MTFAAVVEANTRVIRPKASSAERGPRRRTDRVTATAAESIKTSTPVAYAPAWAWTSARKRTVIQRRWP
jgi:hypothetical protein